MVARRAIWHVHSLGRVFSTCRYLQRTKDQPHWRMDHEPRKNSSGGISAIRKRIQSGSVQSRRMGAHGKGCGNEIHRDHCQTSRWICHVQIESEQMEYCRRYSLWQRCIEAPGGRLQEIWDQTWILLFAGAGLEQPGWSSCTQTSK